MAVLHAVGFKRPLFFLPWEGSSSVSFSKYKGLETGSLSLQPLADSPSGLKALALSSAHAQLQGKATPSCLNSKNHNALFGPR